MWSNGTANSRASGSHTLTEVPVGSYFWFYPSTDRDVSDRDLDLRGIYDTGSVLPYTATYTVGSSDNVALGSLKYDITNETSVTDTAGNAIAAKAVTTIPKTAIDTTAPTATYTVTKSGGVTVSGVEYLGAGDTVTVGVNYGEDTAVAPVVQLKDGTADFGDSLAVSSDNIIYDNTITAASASSDKPIDFGSPSGIGITREALGTGYVYKTTKAFDSLYIGASGNFNSNANFNARTAASKPTTSNFTTHGGQLWSMNSYTSSRTVYGGAVLTDVASGTYFWLFPSAARTVSNRNLMLIEDMPDSAVSDYRSNQLGGHYTASTTKPYDFGTPPASTGVVRETLGTGVVYRTTKPFKRLFVGVTGTIGNFSPLKVRIAGSKPTTANMTTHGTQVLDAPIVSYSLGGVAILSDVPSGSYFWMYPTTGSQTIFYRTFALHGTDVPVGSNYTAVYTVGDGDAVASGSLKYDITNDSAMTDAAGNAVAAKAATAIGSTAVDGTAPVVSSIDASGTTLTVTMSEKLWSGTMPDADNFVITGGGAPSVQSVAGIPSTGATADNSFTLTTASAVTGGAVFVVYTQDGTDGKIPRDVAGNKLANFTQTVNTGVAPSKPSALALGSGLSATDNDDTPEIVVTVGEPGGTVNLYLNSACTIAGSKPETVTDQSSPYTVGVDATALAADGAVSYYAEHTKGGLTSECSTVSVDYNYDGTAPTMSSVKFLSGTKTVTVNMSEDVYAGTTPSATDFSVKSGTAGSETANVVTAITGLASAKGATDDSFELTVTSSFSASDSVKVWYTKGTNAVTDDAGERTGECGGGVGCDGGGDEGGFGFGSVGGFRECYGG